MPVAARAPQRTPSNVTAPPSRSIATQNFGEAQETSIAGRSASRIFVGGAAPCPSQLSARPFASSTAQNVAVAQEIAARLAPTASSALHLPPLSVVAVPLASTIAQNVSDGQEIPPGCEPPGVVVVVDVGPIGIAPCAVAIEGREAVRVHGDAGPVDRAGDRRRAEVAHRPRQPLLRPLRAVEHGRGRPADGGAEGRRRAGDRGRVVAEHGRPRAPRPAGVRHHAAAALERGAERRRRAREGDHGRHTGRRAGAPAPVVEHELVAVDIQSPAERRRRAGERRDRLGPGDRAHGPLAGRQASRRPHPGRRRYTSRAPGRPRSAAPLSPTGTGVLHCAPS